MTQYGMIIDADKCIGCSNCMIACKDEYIGNDYLPLSISQPDKGHLWMKVVEKERGQFPHVKVSYTPTPCMNCKDAPCVKAATGGAVYTRGDGIVIIDPVKAKGQRQIVEACPYGVIYWNEEQDTAQKCTFCAHRVDKGMVPRCVESCPVDALIFGNIDDPNSEISKLKNSTATEKLKPELGINTLVTYTGLPKTFVAGSIVLADSQECGNGAVVSTTDQSGNTKSTSANNFGEFELDGLASGREYAVKVELKSYRPKTLNVKLESDSYLGEISLERA